MVNTGKIVVKANHGKTTTTLDIQFIWGKVNCDRTQIRCLPCCPSINPAFSPKTFCPCHIKGPLLTALELDIQTCLNWISFPVLMAHWTVLRCCFCAKPYRQTDHPTSLAAYLSHKPRQWKHCTLLPGHSACLLLYLSWQMSGKPATVRAPFQGTPLELYQSVGTNELHGCLGWTTLGMVRDPWVAL